MSSPDLISGGGADVAPSLRLMVVGLKGATPAPSTPPSSRHMLPPLPLTKRLAPLHVVTKDGAVMGRLSKNGVYLPHMSVSKVG